MNSKIRVDTSATIKGLENLVKQVRFATSKAMNDAAFIARDAERRHVEEAFTVRRPFVLQGIQVERPYATKANLTVALSVEPKRDFLTKFEEGGTKTPQGQHLAVPDAQTFDRSRVVPRGKRPKALQLRSTTTKGGRVQIEGKQRTYLVTTPTGQGDLPACGQGHRQQVTPALLAHHQGAHRPRPQVRGHRDHHVPACVPSTLHATDRQRTEDSAINGRTHDYIIPKHHGDPQRWAK
jgi:hypothetical protein